MTERQQGDNDEKALWRRAATEHDAYADITGWEANLLAGYLENRLDGEDRAMLEARLAASPALMDALIAARGLPADAAEAPPKGLEARAKTLVEAPAGRPRSLLMVRRSLEWAAAAAALALVSWVGFDLGQETGAGSMTTAETRIEAPAPEFEVAADFGVDADDFVAVLGLGALAGTELEDDIFEDEDAPAGESK